MQNVEVLVILEEEVRRFIPKVFRTVVLCLFVFPVADSFAGPSDYSLRVKVGPSFEVQDWENQARVGGEFDYDLGYSLGFNLASFFGVSDDFRFDLIPSLRFDYLYIGPAALYSLTGAGYSVFNSNNALDLRFGTGLTLPIGDRFEFNTDINLFVVPAGTPGTPVTLDWFLSFGTRFQ